MTVSQILSEMIRIEAEIESGEAKGKISALKAYHRKLFTQYRKAMKG